MCLRSLGHRRMRKHIQLQLQDDHPRMQDDHPRQSCSGQNCPETTEPARATTHFGTPITCMNLFATCLHGHEQIVDLFCPQPRDARTATNTRLRTSNHSFLGRDGNEYPVYMWKALVGEGRRGTKARDAFARSAACSHSRWPGRFSRRIFFRCDAMHVE